MRRRLKIVVCIILVWGAYVVFTGGGLVFWSWRDFGAQRDILVEHGLKADIWMQPTMAETSVPLTAYFHTWRPPYGIRLQIWRLGQFSSIQITELVVEYEDGEVVRVPQPVTARSGLIDNVVQRHANFKLTIVGNLTSSAGDFTVPFRTSMDFASNSGLDVKGWLVSAGGV